MKVHQKFDTILEKLEELTAKVEALTQLVAHGQLQQSMAVNPAEVTQLTSDQPAKPDVEALNRLQEEKSRASSNQQIDDAQLIQLYTFEKTGKRDYRDPSSVPAELLQAAREWDANGRPDVSELPYRMYGG